MRGRTKRKMRQERGTKGFSPAKVTKVFYQAIIVLREQHNENIRPGGDHRDSNA